MNGSPLLEPAALVTVTDLMGAAQALGRLAGSSIFMFPTLLTHRDECTHRSRRTLGANAFEAAHREGAAMSFDTAIGFALGERSEKAQPADQSSGILTKRERQIAALVAQGLTNKAIATRLVISRRTAEGHVEHILTKLGLSSHAQIAVWVAAHADSEPK